jgi:CubicO group peptidase (beta-lactamase class C family)
MSGSAVGEKRLIHRNNCNGPIRYRFRRTLDFDPGERVAYSSFGYCVLGQVIENISGQSYETYIHSQLLNPAGIKKMRIAGPSVSDRAENEVKYFNSNGRSPYDSIALRAFKASSGWIASAEDLVRFALAVDGFPKPPDLLSRASIREMIARPEAKLTSGQRGLFSAKGWDIRRVNDVRFWAKGGGMPGTRTVLVRADNGLVWAALFNSNPGREFSSTLFSKIPKTIHQFTEWPTHDKFFGTWKGTFEGGKNSEQGASGGITLKVDPDGRVEFTTINGTFRPRYRIEDNQLILRTKRGEVKTQYLVQGGDKILQWSTRRGNYLLFKQK